MNIGCQNCGKEINKETDKFVFQNLPGRPYFSCGCVEFKEKLIGNSCAECGRPLGNCDGH